MAKKMVGLGYPVKLEWLNKTIDLIIEGMNADSIKAAIDDYLSYEISGKESLRKTRDILMNIWVRPLDNEEAMSVRSKLIEAVKGGNEDKLVIHWCALLLAYPVFSDITEMIGKLTAMQDSFSQEWLMGKLYEVWGERTTLYQSIRKSLQTMRQIGALSSDNGSYKVLYKDVNGDETTKLILKTILALKKKAYYETSELMNIPQMFPFRYTFNSEMIFGSNDFEIGNFGGSPVVVG